MSLDADATVAQRSVAPHTPTPAQRGAGLTPGQVLADRYRIVGLLGRGGMGEVYRADDLKLGAPVALKFLPASMALDSASIERFHAEVRTARQVAHPHVCRVYDVGEADGRPFLSMEYVDGEDLATLLRRIGRLPPAKAVEIARQLAAGLAAAHEKGVLHRDLKPANVMIDGHGRARITDFGLAVLAADAPVEVAGTPAYMAPEQLAGKPATAQGDIYALGLVYYELFTGKRAIEAPSLPEWRRAHAEDPVTAPSLHTGDVDPVVERLILRCLEKDPALRPRSAAQVALALPGGDPLAAAMAAGETPSPEMVAAAGGEGALAPRWAWTSIVAYLVFVATIFILTPGSTDLGLAPMEKSPEVLKDRAREIVRALGYTERPADEATWLERDYEPIRWLADHVPSTEWRRRLAGIGAPVTLTYRASRAPLFAASANLAITAVDPAPAPGDLLAVVDAKGSLRSLRIDPDLWLPPDPLPAAFPDDALFRATGLDPGRFSPAPLEQLPPVPFDERREWTGTRPETPELPLRLRAASFQGRLTWVTVDGPWRDRDAVEAASRTLGRSVQSRLFFAGFLITISVALPVARRNLRLGRGDRRGAFRLGVAATIMGMLAAVPHLHWSGDWFRFLQVSYLPATARALLSGIGTWLLYIALEPFVRRRIPHLLVGWARLLEGRFKDPLVARDLLLGLSLGACAAGLFHLVNGLPTWFSLDGQTTIPIFSDVALNRLTPAAVPVNAVNDSMQRALRQLAFLFVLRLMTSRSWIVTGVFFLFCVAAGLGAENPLLELPLTIVTAALLTIAMVRLGPLATAAFWFAWDLLTRLPLRAGPTLWYAPHAAATLLFMAALGVLAFRTSLGSRPAFGKARWET